MALVRGVGARLGLAVAVMAVAMMATLRG